MEPPFLIFRDKTARGVEIITSIPLAELYKMQAAARQLMWLALQGDPQAKQSVEAVFALALSNDVERRGKPVVSAYLLREALTEARELQAQQQQQAQQAQQVQQAVQGPSPDPDAARRQQAQAEAAARRQQAQPTIGGVTRESGEGQ